VNKKAFTLVEVITVIVILGILSIGTFVSLKHLYQRVAKSKTLSQLSFDSQLIADQISSMLYDRVPNSVYGYIGENNRTSIYDIISSDNNYTTVEWEGLATEALKSGAYSGFVDMDNSDGNKTLRTYDIYKNRIEDILNKKFGSSSLNQLGLVFAGTFDTGGVLKEYNISDIGTDYIELSTKPHEIYEKYYLIDSSYAIARKGDLPATCIDNNDTNNTLYLFYNYRTWRGENFCSDANVTILSREVSGFEVGLINDSIYLNITLSRKIRGVENNITISKQKVVF